MDNPPFSIFSEIIRFYIERGIKFFLFAPSLTILNYSDRATAIALMANVTYENGANVSTSFVTNMDDKEICARTDPELYKLITEVDKENQRALHKELPKYIYPEHVVTVAMMGRWSRYGVEQSFKHDSTKLIDALDEQKEVGKAIYGKGLLLSEKAAAEKAAAEKAAAEKAAAEKAAAEKAAAEKAAAETWQLSERERAIVAGLE